MRVFPIATFLPDQELISRISCTSQAPDLAALAADPESYLRVVKPQLIEPGLRQGSDEFLETSVLNFGALIRRNSLIPQKEACWFYLQETPEGLQFGGWVLGISVLDYKENRIKKHENTIRDKESRLAKHISLLNSVAEPVLMAAMLGPMLENLETVTRRRMPERQFSDVLHRQHTLWKIDAEEEIALIKSEFGSMSALYIADGHHRSAATALCIRASGYNPESNGIMALVMDKKNLSIKSFHRIIQAPAPVWKLEETCRMKGWRITRTDGIPDTIHAGCIAALSSEGNFLLEPGLAVTTGSYAAKLDVARLECELFPDLFGIENSRIDSRISFLRGDTPRENLRKMLDEGEAGWIFMVAANSMEDIEQVADAGEVMPPKSTWVEPKLMAGMLIMRFNEQGISS